MEFIPQDIENLILRTSDMIHPIDKTELHEELLYWFKVSEENKNYYWRCDQENYPYLYPCIAVIGARIEGNDNAIQDSIDKGIDEIWTENGALADKLSDIYYKKGGYWDTYDYIKALIAQMNKDGFKDYHNAKIIFN